MAAELDEATWSGRGGAEVDGSIASANCARAEDPAADDEPADASVGAHRALVARSRSDICCNVCLWNDAVWSEAIQ